MTANKIALLGTGAMGSRMGMRLLAAGHELSVWNRTPGKTAELAAAGAAVSDSPAAAAEGADYIISMVRDDDASRDVWLAAEGALNTMAQEAIAIECSTLSLPWVRTLAETFEAAGRAFADAPLAGSRPQAEAGALIFFLGCREVDLERLSALLSPMAGAVHRSGQAGSGMVMKLTVNALFGVQLAAVAELIGFLNTAGLNINDAIETLAATPVCSPAMGHAASAMISGQWLPAFPVDLVAKDFELIGRSSDLLQASLPVSRSAGRVYAQGVAQGFSADNITGIVQLYRR